MSRSHYRFSPWLYVVIEVALAFALAFAALLASREEPTLLSQAIQLLGTLAAGVLLLSAMFTVSWILDRRRARLSAPRITLDAGISVVNSASLSSVSVDELPAPGGLPPAAPVSLRVIHGGAPEEPPER